VDDTDTECQAAISIESHDKQVEDTIRQILNNGFDDDLRYPNTRVK
jgi:hypothetical protein